MMENEDGDEEEEGTEGRGDALTPGPRTAPAALPEGEAGEAAPAEGGGQGAAPAAWGGLEPDRPAGAAESPEPVWPLGTGGMAAQAARHGALADGMEEAGEGPRAEKAGGAQAGSELAAAVRGEGGTGLEGLYRQAARASRPAPQALPVGQAGQALRAEEPGRAAALTVEELDRAVRRDSRRYDGGMTIY